MRLRLSLSPLQAIPSAGGFIKRRIGQSVSESDISRILICPSQASQYGDRGNCRVPEKMEPWNRTNIQGTEEPRDRPHRHRSQATTIVLAVIANPVKFSTVVLAAWISAPLPMTSPADRRPYELPVWPRIRGLTQNSKGPVCRSIRLQKLSRQ